MSKVFTATLTFGCIMIGLVMSAGYAYAAGQPNNKAGAIKFVSGVPSKTGCLVCHGDPKILKSKTKSKTKKNLYVSKNMVFTSAHKDLACIECHKDFSRFTATKDHDADIPNYKTTARLSCQGCHDHSKQLQEYSQSIHGKSAKASGEKRRADCVDCHGGHGITSIKKDAAAREQFRLSTAKICGQCHKSHTESYNDYYHGKPFNQLATDAPVCWDCHGSHSIQPKENPASKISEKMLPKTCEKCHVDVRPEFAKEYARLIHGSDKLRAENPLISIASRATVWIDKNMIAPIRGIIFYIGVI